MEELDDEEYYWKMEEIERSKFYESESNLRWIWGAGLYLGKNMVVTSVVISTVPLFLPPLVALSAIGFALSLPAGFVLATYACTDKLMNTLLPMPPPPSYLEPAFEENDDIGSEAKEFEEVPAIVEDVGEVQSLDSNVIPIILEGIREAESEISLMERDGILTPEDTLLAIVVEAEVSEENDDDVEQVTEVLAFVPETDMREETGDEILFVIPEEVKSVGIEGTEDLDKAAGERGKRIEQPEVVIERMVVVNEREMVGEGGVVDNPIEVHDSSSDPLNKRLRGEDLASDSSVDANTDYLEVRIKSISISGHTEIGVDQEITSGFDKALINEEKIWEQINAMRTIIGCKTVAHTSCAEELKVLYEFTGIDLPVSSKDGIDLADVNEKLHFLKSVVGVK